jgi:membrane associated rhomboid family serine protease
VTQALLWSLGIVFLLQQLLGDAAFVPFMLWPWGDYSIGYGADGLPRSVGFMPWQLLSYAFLHGGFFHLFLNGLALYQFGTQLEFAWGPRRFATYFFVCVIGAGLIQLAVASYGLAGDGFYPTIGASGGVFGLLLAYGMLFPHQRVMLLIPPVPMKARTLVIVFGAIELLTGITGLQSGIAHFAHLGGMLFGWLLIRYWRGQPPFGRRRRRPPGLRSVR